MKKLDKGHRDGLIEALKADISSHPDKREALMDLKEKIMPVLTSIYGKEDTSPILEVLEKSIKRSMEEAEEMTKDTTEKLSVKTGDIYIASQRFEDIGATIDDGEYILIGEDYGFDGKFKTCTAENIEDLLAGDYIESWTLRADAIQKYCTKYVDPKVAAAEAKAKALKNVPVRGRRMNQDEFRSALAAL